MTQITVESVFGEKAGAIWRALNQNGPSNITNLVKTTSLSREEIFSALGWLGREDKILLEQKGREMIFSLRDPEARQEAVAEGTAKMTAQEISPKGKAKSKTKRSKAKPLKKPKKAGAVKSSSNQEVSQENAQQEGLDKESDRTKDYLLH
ncbi:MAG: winged helix-turn-helix domain-containing protein [Methanothrix sp.]|nr:winged helix-turn-helix domain-containing protein [Methanothrix sp.]